MGKKLDIKSDIDLALNPVLGFINTAESVPNIGKEVLQPVSADNSVLEHQIESNKAKNTKTRRVQLLLKESTYTKAKSYAKARGISVNELVNVLIDTIKE